MALVNCTDADRSSIEDYLVELEQVLQNNQSMITKLREVRPFEQNFEK